LRFSEYGQTSVKFAHLLECLNKKANTFKTILIFNEINDV